MSNVKLHVLPVDSFLPGSISADWRTPSDIGAWLQANGFRVIATIETDRYAHATTADGFRVYRNGWCCKAPVVEARP